MARSRTRYFGIRLSTGELLRITATAESLAMTRTAWVRQQVLRAAEGAPKALPVLRAAPRQGPLAKLTRSVSAHLTEDQFEAVNAYARACGLTVADFLRQLILGFRPIARRPVARSAIVAVNRASASFNQLVQLGNSGTVLMPDLMHAVAVVRNEIHSLRDALLRADAAESSEPSE
jgi:hypothetical protein